MLDADGDFVLVKNAVIIEQELEAWSLSFSTALRLSAGAAANDNVLLDRVLQNISLTRRIELKLYSLGIAIMIQA